MATVPVINARCLRQHSGCCAELEGVIDQIGSACREWGFFQVIHHGIPADLIVQLREQARAFFAAPAEVKNAISRSTANPRGYWDYELTKRRRDWREGFDFGSDGVFEVDGENQWPQSDALPDFRATMTEYFDAVGELASLLTSAMAKHLGLEDRFFQKICTPRHSSFIRLNHYPRCPNPEDNLGVGPHTDASLITVLLQDDVDGLQFDYHGKWCAIQPMEGAYVVNVGDLLRVFSNDEFRSPSHRAVVRAEADRFSVPFFLNPAYDAICAPAAQLVPKDQPAMYRPFLWGEFRSARYAGNIADLGVEIQISNYSIHQPTSHQSDKRQQ